MPERPQCQEHGSATAAARAALAREWAQPVSCWDRSVGLAGITASEVADRMGRYAGYVEDNFKASPRLTLNLGLRYDLILPTVSAHNQFSWMDPTVVNPAIGIRGAEVFATPGERSPVHTDTKAFGPRIGLA